MTGNENTEPDDPYCSRRVDNEERWSFIRRHVDSEHDSLLDVGCAEGYFTNAAAADGLEATGIEVKEDRYEYAVANYGSRENVRFERRQITPETVAELPPTDVTLVLTVQHHWVGAFGVEAATEMLRTIAGKTDLLFYEPPGTMFLGKQNPIAPDESRERYRAYLRDEFDDRHTIVDVAMFQHVDEGEWRDRSDPLFVIDTEGIGE